MPTFFKFDPKSTTKIASAWCRLCDKKDFQSLAEYVAEFKRREGWIEKFFEKEGSYLLYNALLFSDEPDRLNFMIKNIPESIVAEGLAQDDYRIIKELLFMKNNTMLQGEFSDIDSTNFRKKLELLLSIEETQTDIIEVLNEAEFTTGEAISLCDSMKNILASCLPQSSDTSSICP